MSIAKGCVFCIAMVAGWLISYSFGIEDALLSNSDTQDWVSQNEQDDSYSAAISQDRQRVARAISDPRRNCSTWAEWVNENHPSLSHKEDKEFISQRTRQEFCPSGKISKFECKDDKGEPFQRNFTSLDGTFFISCYDINVGVICTISNTSSAYIKHCPDMSIRYYCSCPALHIDHTISAGASSTSTSQTAQLSTATTSVMTRDSPRILSKTAMTNFLSSFMSSPSVSKTVSVVSTKTSRLAETSTATGTVTFADGEETKKDEIYKEEAELKLGDLSISWWTFVLSVVGLIFLLNTCISVCLFRKVKNLMEKKHPKQAVHPTPFL